MPPAMSLRYRSASPPTMPVRHRSISPPAHYQEASPPPLSREVTVSPKWEQDSDRGGHIARGRPLQPSDPVPKYPVRDGLDSYERSRRGQDQLEPHRDTTSYRPPSPIVKLMPPLNLPAKPVQQSLPEHSRPRALRASPQRAYRAASPDVRLVQRRDVVPLRELGPPKRSDSPASSRGQRRDPPRRRSVSPFSPVDVPTQRWTPPRRRSVSPPASHSYRRPPSPPRDRISPERLMSPESRGPRRHPADVHFPPPDRKEVHYLSEKLSKTPDSLRRAPDVRDPVDMDVDDVPSRQHLDHGRREQMGNHYERPPVNRRGGSLLDRLSMSVDDHVPPLRDRVQIPTKRDRDELMRDGGSFNGEFDVDDGVIGKKPRRRTGKPRRGRGRGAHA
ncbi:hypothetical protein J3R30DRAFT_2084272 [Lentinula aciculospora]|uniref:Uncharacterized protein n=1 Tax=Lentinula aciculospora TaxID=153920 RepID=A0A9W9DEV5_9AGAR|nr:hypothetical protein J3R30DRAFT_2084272 [Lentinula aciculospora]